MKRNMGATDRVVRIIIALVIAGLYYAKVITGTLGVVLLVVAGIFLLTSLISFCPLYGLFGMNTCSNKNEKKLS
jgi:hypothetical protein